MRRDLQENLLPKKKLRWDLEPPDVQKNSENPEAEKKKWSAMVPHNEKSRFGRKKELRPRPPLWMIWTWIWLFGVFLWKPRFKQQFILVHTVWKIYDSLKNESLMSVKQLFQVTEKLIKNQTEISGLTTVDYEEFTWSATSLLCDKAFQITNAKTYVFVDSVLCLEAWKKNQSKLGRTKLNGIGRIVQDSPRWASSRSFKN